MRVPLPFRSRDAAYKSAVEPETLVEAIKGSVYREIPVDQLVSTQHRVNDARVVQFAAGRPAPKPKHTPIVVQRHGRYYIHNGHHRATAARLSGEKTIRARLATLDKPRKFASDAPAGTLLMIDPRAMAAKYTPREEPYVEIVAGGIAVLTIEGPLESKAGGCWFAYYDDYESIMQRFRDALESEKVRGILLKIDSPGGMAAGLNATVDAMRKLKNRYGKMVCAYADEKCCSAAYALACVADEIYLPPAAEMGSIGVTSTIVDATKANKKAGLNVVVLTSGKRKSDGNPDVQLTAEAQRHIQKRVDHLANIYFRLVERARGIPADEVKALEANTFDGKHAVRAGLADAVWTLEKTLKYMRSQLDKADRKNGTLDQPAEGVSKNVRSPTSPEDEEMTKKMSAKKKLRAVSKARAQLKKALSALDAAEKTPPAKETDEEDEEEGSGSDSAVPSDDEEEGSTDGSTGSTKPSEEDEEEGSSAEDEEDEEEGSSAEDEEDEEERYEDDEEEKEASKALLALAQKTTGKKGARAVGALAALIAEGARAAKAVRRVTSERKQEKKALSISNALSERRITRIEAKDLAGKSSGFVRDFLSMRKQPLVATEEDALHTPHRTAAGDLPAMVMNQIDQACAAITDPEESRRMRKALIKSHRERLANSNGAGGTF